MGSESNEFRLTKYRFEVLLSYLDFETINALVPSDEIASRELSPPNPFVIGLMFEPSLFAIKTCRSPFRSGKSFSNSDEEYSKINLPMPPPICVGVGNMVGVGLGVCVAVGTGVKVCVGADVGIAVTAGAQEDKRITKSKSTFTFFMLFSFFQQSNFQSLHIF